jgi:flagellar biosynthesis/type III secretory pathway protein FliH
MLHYTPLEKTVAGQELIMMGIEKGRIEGIEKGIEKGRIEGIEKGKIIGKIHATQRFLKRRITSEKKLLRYGIGELRAELKQLEAELKHS